MKKQQLQKILDKKYIRLPLKEDEPWPKTRYVTKPLLNNLDWNRFNSEEEFGQYLLDNYQQINEKIVGKMNINLKSTIGEYAALKGDILDISWWKEGCEISFEDWYESDYHEDESDYRIDLCVHLERMRGEWEYSGHMTDDLEVCRVVVLGTMN